MELITIISNTFREVLQKILALIVKPENMRKFLHFIFEKSELVMNFVVNLYKGNPKKMIFLTACSLFWGLTLGAIYKYQNNLLYIPDVGQGKYNQRNIRSLRHPSNRGLDSDDIEIVTKDKVVLRGWHIKREGASRLITFFQGNAGNTGSRLEFLESLSDRTNSEIIIFGYRGYSESEGSPSQAGLELDSEAILAYSAKIADERKLALYVFGRSIGGAVAIYGSGTAHMQNKISGLILENTFTSINNVLYSMNPVLLILSPIISVLNRNPWTSINRIGRVNCPALFIKGMQDKLIPPRMSDELRKECDRHHTANFVIEVAEGDHNNTWVVNPERYFSQINEFMNNYGKKAKI